MTSLIDLLTHDERWSLSIRAHRDGVHLTMASYNVDMLDLIEKLSDRPAFTLSGTYRIESITGDWPSWDQAESDLTALADILATLASPLKVAA